MKDSMKDPIVYVGQFPFQAKYGTGKVLNVGCNSDGAGFRSRGGINIDLFAKDEHTGMSIPAHALADARRLPFRPGSFDSVILGEILEHMQTHDSGHLTGNHPQLGLAQLGYFVRLAIHPYPADGRDGRQFRLVQHQPGAELRDRRTNGNDSGNRYRERTGNRVNRTAEYSRSVKGPI